MNWHDWGMPIAVLAVGVMVGLFVAIRARGGLSPDSKARLKTLLRARKEALISSLVELEKDPTKNSEEWIQKVDSLRAAASNCLRDLEALGEELPQLRVDRMSRSRVLLGWTLGSIGVLAAVIGLMMTMVMDEATVRVRPMTEQIAEAQEILETRPNDIDANNLVTYWTLNQLVVAHLEGALSVNALSSVYTESGLETRLGRIEQHEPESPGHRLNFSVLTTLFSAVVDPGYLSGAAEGFSSLEDSEVSPSVLALWRAWYRLVQGDRELALQTLDSVSEDDLNEFETRVHTLLRSRLESQVMARVRVDEGDVAVNRGEGLVYITIQDSESGTGMPHAVKRVSGGFLSNTIEVDQLDVLPMRQGAPWPDPYWIHAFYDADGVVERGKSEQDPRNVFAEPLGPFSLDTPVEVQVMKLDRVSQAALVPLPDVSALIKIEAPWLEWDFNAFGIQEGVENRVPRSRAEHAMAQGDLASALGWLSLMQQTSEGLREAWFLGALLQHLAGEQEIAKARMDLKLADSASPHLWLWSAWMAADRGSEAAWKVSLGRAEQAGARNEAEAFFQWVSSMEFTAPVTLSASVDWSPDGMPEGMAGKVWVVVRGETDTTGLRQAIAVAALELAELPGQVSRWQMMGATEWPRAVWVEAYVSTEVGRSNALAASPLLGPLRIGAKVELVLDPVPPKAPPGHP